MTIDTDNGPQVRARKIASTILKATQRDATQAAIATAMGLSEATVSRMLSDQLDKFSQLLAHAGLKVVPVEVQCYSPEKIGALLTLARDHLSQIQHTEQLRWD